MKKHLKILGTQIIKLEPLLIAVVSWKSIARHIKQHRKTLISKPHNSAKKILPWDSQNNSINLFAIWSLAFPPSAACSQNSWDTPSKNNLKALLKNCRSQKICKQKTLWRKKYSWLEKCSHHFSSPLKSSSERFCGAENFLVPVSLPTPFKNSFLSLKYNWNVSSNNVKQDLLR